MTETKVVTIEVPLAVRPTSRPPKHLAVTLTRAVGRTIARIRDGLRAQGARLQVGGAPVDSYADAVRWVLAEIGRADEVSSEPR